MLVRTNPGQRTDTRTGAPVIVSSMCSDSEIVTTANLVA